MARDNRGRKARQEQRQQACRRKAGARRPFFQLQFGSVSSSRTHSNCYLFDRLAPQAPRRPRNPNPPQPRPSVRKGATASPSAAEPDRRARIQLPLQVLHRRGGGRGGGQKRSDPNFHTAPPARLGQKRSRPEAILPPSSRYRVHTLGIAQTHSRSSESVLPAASLSHNQGLLALSTLLRMVSPGDNIFTVPS
jgi:hypothetical protein